MPQTLRQDDPLVHLFASFRTMSDRHKAALDPYLDVEGYVEDDHRRAHTRRERTDALEAKDFLEQVMGLLAEHYALPNGLTVTLPGTDGTSHTLITGQLDAAAREVFLHGQCHAFARALSDHTGWPMAVIIADDCALSPVLCAAEDVVEGVCTCQLEHVVAVRPDGAHIDITGAHLPGAVPRYEGQEAITLTDALWSHISRSPLWRRPAVDEARTFVAPLLATLDSERGAA
ncbi:hypothetical protein [Streptomyces noursei]|uniref:hypothetical protein n=1 Tax=Streptomyces noursei TaxID=1971 RepID=UPI00167B8881|nr:hypothetical protein [Streptomyces noursei]MCZ1021361.1 hypothetical protein [Streptomyces noursei]GGX54508.1 hypothetical protein GCM10010341_89540 [Streptomyces noursei]